MLRIVWKMTKWKEMLKKILFYLTTALPLDTSDTGPYAKYRGHQPVFVLYDLEGLDLLNFKLDKFCAVYCYLSYLFYCLGTI